MTKSQEAAFMRYERQYPFMRGDGCAVELHWTVAPWPVSFLLDSAHLWERTRKAGLGGGSVSTFSPEDLILTLCVHGSAHLWERLGWVCDVAEVVRVSSRDVDWERLVERADALNIKRMLFLGLFLANELLGTDLPELVLHQARLDRGVRVLAAEVSKRLFLEAKPQEVLEEVASWGFHVQSMERLRDKLRYCIHRATTPNSIDWDLMPLPAALFPCYRVLRPIRLVGRFGRSLVGSRYDGGNKQLRSA